VVVGPRSALFSPLKDPALIILDEEHDGSYKQGNTPRYHAREAAQKLAGISGGCVVLGSATPSVESYHAALTDRYGLLELPERVRQRPLPTVELVDLRQEAKARPGQVFGGRLEESIRQRVADGEQVILFLNRRGYSAFLLCRDCGYVPRCPNCDVSLTLHRHKIGFLLCHHCDHTQRAPHACPRCLGPKMRQFGLGTQRVEDEVRKLFPSARVARLDRDTIGTKDAHTKIVNAVRDREVDILVGTQMVTKGFDFPGVTLVGVVTADVALNMPDFRASERAFQLLTQVSGRAGRGDRPGEVVVQTFNPEHASIQAASRHDYRSFYTDEIRHREECGYPPFGSLARFLVSHPEEAVAKSRIEAAAELVRPYAERLEVEVRGPAPCPLSRLKDRFRFHLLLKGKNREQIRGVLDAAWPQVQRGIGGVVVDVEPVDLL
jgi:primosomal protein N' (replication factor Y)